MICIVCGCNEFSLHSGVYFCCECNTQIEATQEEQTESESFSKRSLLSSPATEKKSKDKRKFYVPWTTTEAYNIILYKQVSALVKLGASPQLKNTVLYIWSQYLQKCEIAFRTDYNSKEKVPRLGPFPRRRDMKVLYGDKTANIRRKFYKGKRIKRKINPQTSQATLKESSKSDNSASSLISISDESDNHLSSDPKGGKCRLFSSAAKKLQRQIGRRTLKQMRNTSRDNCVLHMTLYKTLCFCYLGLLYCQDQLLLSDVLRFATEERIPYICATSCLPPSMKLQCDDAAYLTKYEVPDMWKISLMCSKIMDFLNLPKFEHRSILPIVCRYIKDLNLPDDLISVVKKLVDKSKESSNELFETKKLKQNCVSIPVYEVQAMAYIIVALKMMFVLDDSFEKQ